MIVMIAMLLLRSLVCFFDTKFMSYVDTIVVIPIYIQFLMEILPFIKRYPLLPVRVAESVMGRISPSELMMVIPAHVLGNCVGIVLFHSAYPFGAPPVVFQPIVFDRTGTNGYNLITEVLVVFVYVTIVLVLPDLLEANKASPKWLTIPLIGPVLMMKSAFLNPSAVYSLWYVNHSVSTWSPLRYATLLSTTLKLKSAADVATTTATSAAAAAPVFPQLDYMVVSLLAALAAGLFVKFTFPEDGSWQRKKM